MKPLIALLLAGGLMVPLFSTEAFCAKPSATAPHKKAPRHKRHVRHAAAKPSSAATSVQKTPPQPTTPE